MSTIYVDILGTGANGELNPTILIYCNQVKYMINCCEHSNRLAKDHKLHLKRGLRHIFFTQNRTINVGGYIDIMIESQENPFNLFGPTNLINFLLSTQTTFFQPHLVVNVQECGLETEILTPEEPLQFIPVVLSIEKQHSEPQSSTFCINYSRYKPQNLSVFRQAHDVVCYICHTPTILGKFDVTKATHFGVPKGPLFNQLKNGKDVTLENGTIVYSKDCVGPSSIGPILIIVDCPSIEYLSVLISHPRFTDYYKNSKFGSIVSCIIHITSFAISQTTEYKNWMNSFSSDVKHIFLNEKCRTQDIFPTSTEFQMKLYCVHPEIFPLLPKTKPTKELSDSSSILYGETLMRIHIQPISQRNLIEKFPIREMKLEEVKNNLEKDLIFKNLYKDLQGKIKLGETSQLPDELVILGTSGAASTKYRSETCQIITLEGYGNILMDCGEGSYFQLVRAYGEQVEQILKALKCIFISHKHPDHIRGVLSFLSKRRDALNLPQKDLRPKTGKHQCPECKSHFSFRHSLEQHRFIHLPNNENIQKAFEKLYRQSKSGELQSASELFLIEKQESTLTSEEALNIDSRDIPVIGPFWTETYLLESNLIEPLYFHFIDSAELCSRDNPFQILFLKELGVRIQTTQVIHSFPTYGICIEKPDDWKLVFSGDTRPCQDLVSLVSNPTVLLHEANFEEDMGEKALLDKHSTAQEAIEVGKRMGALRTILTHFSTRIEGKIVDITKLNTETVGLAFDFMRVKLNTKKSTSSSENNDVPQTNLNPHLEALPSLNPILFQIFNKENE